ncbi:MAG: hypothetical protein HC906_16445 [Bacteroidales bacterium]|nr:hypothetical protein [Bacteroidales bacterium]
MVKEYNTKNNSHIAAIYESYDWRTTGNFLFQHLFKSAINDPSQTISLSFSQKKEEALRKTLNAFEELGKYQPIISSHNENQWFETRDYMLNDSCLFYINGSWMYSHWKSIDSDKFKKILPAELPVFQKVNYYLGGYMPTWGVLMILRIKQKQLIF